MPFMKPHYVWAEAALESPAQDRSMAKTTTRHTFAIPMATSSKPFVMIYAKAVRNNFKLIGNQMANGGAGSRGGTSKSTFYR